MNVHDPDDRAPSTDRPESPLPRRTPTAALYALRPVPSPRSPGDGPVRPGPEEIPPPRGVSVPRPAPRARHAEPSTGPVTRVQPDGAPLTPPMPWAPASPPGGGPPARRRPSRLLESDMDRRVALALAVAVVLVAAAALVLNGVAAPDTAPAPAEAPAAGAPDVAGEMTVVDAAAFGGDEPAFRSPTGNIGCRMDRDGVRCQVDNRSWQVPDCPPADGASVSLTGTGPASASCGTAGSGSARTLAYGSALRRGDTVCASRRDGVECRDSRSGHGFTVARSSYRAY